MSDDHHARLAEDGVQLVDNLSFLGSQHAYFSEL